MTKCTPSLHSLLFKKTRLYCARVVNLLLNLGLWLQYLSSVDRNSRMCSNRDQSQHLSIIMIIISILRIQYCCIRINGLRRIFKKLMRPATSRLIPPLELTMKAPRLLRIIHSVMKRAMWVKLHLRAKKPRRRRSREQQKGTQKI